MVSAAHPGADRDDQLAGTRKACLAQSPPWRPRNWRTRVLGDRGAEDETMRDPQDDGPIGPGRADERGGTLENALLG
jgi:hypothetical protein